MTPPTSLYLVRHAETEANASAVWHGSFDAPLTARGQRQVAATAMAFAELASAAPFDALVSSPLQRARTTAAAIAHAISPQAPESLLIIDEELGEFSIGDWEGRSFDELRTVERMWERWATDPEFTPPNGESPASFNRRALATLRRLTQTHAGRRLIVVTHGGYICNVLAVWLGKGPQDWRNFEVDNCSITVLQGNGDLWQPLVVNDTRHLQPDLVARLDTSAWRVPSGE